MSQRNALRLLDGVGRVKELRQNNQSGGGGRQVGGFQHFGRDLSAQKDQLLQPVQGQDISQVRLKPGERVAIKHSGRPIQFGLAALKLRQEHVAAGGAVHQRQAIDAGLESYAVRCQDIHGSDIGRVRCQNHLMGSLARNDVTAGRHFELGFRGDVLTGGRIQPAQTAGEFYE